MIRQSLLPEDLRKKLSEMDFHFQSGSVSEAFESYLQWEGIIGYGDQILQALAHIQQAYKED